MALGQLNFKGQDKVEVAIKILQICEPPEGYLLNNSGGKDSAALEYLCYSNKIKYKSVYGVSPVDPPQIRQHLKDYYPDTEWIYNAKGFLNLVAKNQLPMRNQRWCCRYVKESIGKGRVNLVGVRRYEGANRSKQCFISEYDKPDKVIVRPIIDWTDSDVWEYIRINNIPYCSLYDEGAKPKDYGYGKGIFKRLGCVLCPFSRDIERDELYFPQIVKFWKLACQKVLDYHQPKGSFLKFNTGEELYQWWVSRK